MNLPIFCIKKPVFSIVLSLILVVIGILGYQNLQTKFFPKFERNMIVINTSYPGASASLVEKSITTPLENALSGIEGVDEMKSLSSQGSSSIYLLLADGADITDFDNNVHDQVAMAESSLPSAVKAPSIQTGFEPMELLDIAFSADDNHIHQLRDYLDHNVIDRIEELPGIAAVTVSGANQYAMRITLDPIKMAALKISVNTIQEAINNNNLQLPAGEIKSSTMNFPVTAKTELKTAEQFGDIVLKNSKGKLIYLKDVATVALGSSIASKSIVRMNGKRAILLSVYNAIDANPMTASLRIRALLKQIKMQLPNSIHAVITFDQANYMQSSITEVYKSIFLSIFFVALIIFLFLGKIRSSLIPIVTIPICIMATMAAMHAFGFSLNIITLLAIVLSIGLVVDDAIVVMENIHRHIENGMNRFNAAIQGSSEIATPVIAMTLTLAAVYAPIGFIKGIVSHIFASFAYTLASAVIISGFVALTLSPMMCSKLLPEHINKKNVLHHKIEDYFERFTYFYQKLLSTVLNHKLKIVIITILFSIISCFFIAGMPKTFVPKEDMGLIITLLNASEGANADYVENQLQQLNQLLSKNKSIKTNVSVVDDVQADGQPPMIFSTLKNYQNRDETANQIAKNINKEIQKIPNLSAITIAPSFGGPPQNQVEFYITAPTSYANLYQISNNLIKKLSSNPGFKNIQSNIKFNNQQYTFTINRELTGELQVNASDIDNTVGDFLGGTAVSTFNLNGQTYDVDMRAAKPYLENINAINQFQVPSLSGQFIPLANLIHIQSTLSQTSLYHYNRMRAARISADLSSGYSMGNAVQYLEKILPKILPSQAKYAFTGEAEHIQKSSGTMMNIFILALVFIYLVLSAQFESFFDPFIILLAVPLSVIGALMSLKLINGSINIYTMIGLVTLVGLIAKHGILITQFANTLQKTGKNISDALIQAASIRLRPILMTTAAMIGGALPLIFASGASAISREQIGAVIIGGLLFGTFFSLILVPIAYIYIGKLKSFKKTQSKS